MAKFQVIYFFEKDFSVSRLVEVETVSEVIQNVKDQDGMIEFTDSEDTFHRFHLDNIKLVSIKTDN
ncbi:hypothetical protein [Bacillus sp. T33-2]|uniref:hypothetical protein n=1 Tax=Bacillus sp. T33-2 TaxID=2054168 RepID=UPI000C779096|nr:hypothetical protein [Bacillus sp. T33-2]PLR97496.1 hypothetical protein CVD19_08380 [Bacillus sp. T33-2]